MTETIEPIVLASRPVGEPTLDNFRSEKLPIPHLGSDEMLLRTLWLSLDPYMRGRMSDALLGKSAGVEQTGKNFGEIIKVLLLFVGGVVTPVIFPPECQPLPTHSEVCR